MSWDFMATLRYFLATESENNGLTQHKDGNCLSFVFQDDTDALQPREKGSGGAICLNLIDSLLNDIDVGGTTEGGS
ncbi:hypothetical protein V6N13_084869 [Hibiscus sabdariffa]